MAYHEEEPEWHTGEQAMHRLLRVPEGHNPTSHFLSPFAANLLVRSPIVALGIVDSENWPWSSVWGGEAGFSGPVAESAIGLKNLVDRANDPVLLELLGDKADGEVIQSTDRGKMVGGLAIDLENRRRVKLYGRSIAGVVKATHEGVGEVQLAINIEQSMGNCPKYLNKKHIIPHIPKPQLVANSFPIPEQAIDLLKKADLFFISSSNHNDDMDTNIRGGPPGFVRVLSNTDDEFTIVYPEYSGNRLYQTLGNLKTTPRAGLVFPDFDTGDVLYVTGTTEIVHGKAASDLIGHTNLAVIIHVKHFKFVQDGLAFRGLPGEPSPYNPPVRYLAAEKSQELANSGKQVMATLISKKILAPSVGRFRFQVSNPEKKSAWKPGQYVALSFEDELDIGYSHMRDDDPKSLNDDYLRTFTVSSRQDDPDGQDQFDITIRKVGPVTTHLFKTNVRANLEVPIQGFGGEFYIQQDQSENVSFIAGGVGITPVLAQVKDLDLKRFTLYWTMKVDDIPFVVDTFERNPGLAQSTKLFITGDINENKKEWKYITASGADIRKARLTKVDLEHDTATRWYLCTGPGLRKTLLTWLEGKTTIYEDFNY